MSPKRLIPGDEYDQSARTHGEFIDAVEALRAGQVKQMGDDEHTHAYNEGTIVNVLNLSGENVPCYGILELDTPRAYSGGVLDVREFVHHVYLAGNAPGADWKGYVYGIAQHPITDGHVGEMLVIGITQAKVLYDSIDSLEYHYAEPIQGDVEKLKAVSIGPIGILWSERVLGNVWALITTANIAVRDVHIHFELYENLIPGGRALAYPRWYNVALDEYVTDIDDDKRFYVSDVEGLHRGRGRDSFAAPNNKGSIGESRYFMESNRFEIERMQAHSYWLIGEIATDFECDAVEFEILPEPNRAFSIGSVITNTDPAENITVKNIFGVGGTGGDKAIVWWNEEEEQYEGVDLTPDRVEIITALRYDATTHQLQKKISDAQVLHLCELEVPESPMGVVSDWTLWHQAVQITPVNDLRLNPAETYIQTKDCIHYVLEDDGMGDWVTKIDTTKC